MPVTKLNTSSTTDVMRPDEGNDSIDSIIRQAIGKEPVRSFPRASESPAQWIQIVQALDQPEFVGWPLLTQLKVQMQKCDKCSREFCSSINYRRHMRVHHRFKRLDKDTARNRDLMAAFWDKLSEDETKEILSLKDVTLEGVPSSSIVKSLTALTRKPGFSCLPQYCLRAGSILLDIIDARSSRFPFSSEEFFSILDDASENTFLCGSAVSMQKYIFDGEPGKIGLETKNLVASTSFLVELTLVKAWLADKDVEALRCQKLLVEEEEAAQRRQAELLERKRQKKLRQKEQKAKEQRQEEKDAKEHTDDMLEDVTPAEQSCPLSSDSDTHSPETLLDHASFSTEPFQPAITEQQAEQGNSHRHMPVAQYQMPKKLLHNHLSNGFHASQNAHVPKLSAVQRHGSQRDAKPYGNGKWGQKPKLEVDGDSLRTRVQKEVMNQPDKIKNNEVLIGSISVTLGNSSCLQDNNLIGAQHNCQTEQHMPDEHQKEDDIHCDTNQSTVKLWRPVSRSGKESNVDVIAGKGEDHNLSSDSYISNGEMGNSSPLKEERLHLGSLHFSNQAAKAFLAERWKEAIAADHVTLVLSPNLEPSAHRESERVSPVVDAQSSDAKKRNISGNPPNRLANGWVVHEATAGSAKSKLRTKTEKGVKLKYIPKQRATT